MSQFECQMCNWDVSISPSIVLLTNAYFAKAFCKTGKHFQNRGGADSDILMKSGSECSEKPVLPGFSEENQA